MRILITGATGKVGRHLTKFLLEKGQEIITVSRNPGTVEISDGVQSVKADLSEPASFEKVLSQGVDAVYVNLAAVETELDKFMTQAVEAGIRLAVVQSAITVQYGGGYKQFSERFRLAEETIMSSGLRWANLRCSDFASNSTAWIPQIQRGDIIRGAYGEARTSPIHERDVAAVATELLTHDKYLDHSYAITGPEALNQFDKARIIGEISGRNIHFEEVSPNLVRTTMLNQGFTEEVADRMIGYLSTCANEPGPITDTVEKILDRPALSFSNWVEENRFVFGNK